MADEFEIHKGVPVPPPEKRKTGMTEALRKMEHLDCIIIPNSKRASVYACAAQAGIKIRTKGNPDGASITVWRIMEDGDDATAKRKVTVLSLENDGIHTPDGDLPTGHYTRPDPYGPNVWAPDVDEFGRLVNLNKQNKTPKEVEEQKESIFL